MKKQYPKQTQIIYRYDIDDVVYRVVFNYLTNFVTVYKEDDLVYEKHYPKGMWRDVYPDLVLWYLDQGLTQ